ncbi:MAG: hypothetical protein ACRDE2_04370 [Chitinophagaceae bacterium]
MSDQLIRNWPPLTEEEKKFISFWEKERDQRHKWTFQIRRYFLRGIMFGFPIALFFFIEAPRHRGLISHSDLAVIMFAIVMIVLFYAVFMGATKWDEYESHYQILKMKEAGRSAAVNSQDNYKIE